MSKCAVYSDEFNLAILILKYQDMGEPIWFSKACELLPNINRNQLSDAFDRLEDMMMINSEWTYNKEGKRVMTYTIDESFIYFVRSFISANG